MVPCRLKSSNYPKTALTLGIILTAGVGLAATACAAGQAQQLNQVINPPSAAAVAKKSREERAKLPPAQTPLFTNDNLPTGKGGGVGVTSGSPSASSSKGVLGTKPISEMIQTAAYLSHKLGAARARLEMHTRELAVIEQQLAQNKMQYYPDPSKTLFQEYSRQDVNNKKGQLDDKKQQIADDQDAVERLQTELSRLQEQLSWAGVSAQSLSGKNSVIPPGVKPGTHAYWRARFQAAHQAIATAHEQERLTREETKLLKLQQLRTLNPNAQSQLAAQIIAKGQQEQAAQQAVEKTQNNLEELQKEFEASGAPASWAE
ncbi:MAG: hypothetical protein ACRD10_09885 [Terriglobia bacterium]